MDTGWLIEEMDDEEEEFLEYLEKTRCNCQAETLHSFFITLLLSLI